VSRTFVTQSRSASLLPGLNVVRAVIEPVNHGVVQTRRKSVLIFAEGTRTHTGSLLPFKRGAFSIAARSGIPIIPVAINNTFSILQKGSLNVQAAPITLRIGSVIETSGSDSREDDKRLLDETRTQIEKMYIVQHV